MNMDFTGGELLALFVFAFAVFFGVGILLGLSAASAVVTILGCNGVVLKPRYKIAASLFGAVVGAVINFVVVNWIIW